MTPLAVSVVVTSASSRADNLRQSLSALRDGEPGLDLEVIVVFQDHAAGEVGGADVVVELGLSEFRKGLMVNQGVAVAGRDVILIMDGDRVVPPNYLKDVLGCLLTDRVVVAPRGVLNLPSPLGDDALRHLRDNPSPALRWLEMRGMPSNLFVKTHFSGHAVMNRKDFDAVGGMDETYCGYGFSDNDFGMRCKAAGLLLRFAVPFDIHLWHARDCDDERYWAQNCGNGVRFCRRWNLSPSLAEVPERIRDEFINMLASDGS